MTWYGTFVTWRQRGQSIVIGIEAASMLHYIEIRNQKQSSHRNKQGLKAYCAGSQSSERRAVGRAAGGLRRASAEKTPPFGGVVRTCHLRLEEH